VPSVPPPERAEHRFAADARSRIHGRVMAGAFVLLWCTGYPAGKIAVAHAGPFVLLLLRFSLAALVFIALAAWSDAGWPSWRAIGHSAVVGLLSLALQFAGVYWGLHLGVSTGVAALIVGALPLATGLVGRFFGERLGRVQWIGLALGFAGVLLILRDRLAGGHADLTGHLCVLAGLFGLALGNLYQKRHAGGIDIRVGLAVQHVAAAIAVAPFALWLDHLRADGSAAFVMATAWIVLVNAVAGFALMSALLRRGEATQVATLFYLMPAVTALMGYVLLGERLSPSMLPGFGLVVAGIRLATHRRAQR